MKKKIKIKLPPVDILKENAEERKKRVQNSKPMGTKVEEKKKVYKRHEKHKKGYQDYE